MSDPSLAIQAALVAALRELGTAAGSHVYDMVPASDPFPRITIDGGQSVPGTDECLDDTESFFQIDVWSRKTGYPETKTIANAVRSRLHNGELEINGHVLVLMHVRSIDYSRDADGLTSRARITLRTITQSI